MATEGIFSAYNAPPASAATPVVSEQSQPVHSVLNTAQKESEGSFFEKSKAAAGGENPEALRSPQQVKPTAESSTEHPLSGSIASSEPTAPVESRKGEADDTKPEPQTGEKRAFDSTVIANSAPAPPPVPATAPAPVSEIPTPAAPAPASIPEATSTSEPITHPAPAPAPVPVPVPAPAPASDERDKPLPEKSDEPDAKKQKVDPEPSKDSNNAAPSGSVEKANGEQKKPAPTKKEKVKDAVKKIIPSDGPGTRTRSRTKPT
ncbi:unnamed protein product [Penicillium pancosmium]